MAIDISKLMKPQWKFKSENLEEWDVKHLSTNAMIAIGKKLLDSKADAHDIVRVLARAVLVSPPTDEVEGEEKERSPSEIQLHEFTDADLDEFSRQFVEHNKDLRDDEGPTKREDQSHADFLVELLKNYQAKQAAIIKEMFAGMNSSLNELLSSRNPGIRSVSEDLLKQTSQLERLAQPSYLGNEALRILHLGQNPAHETNSHLQEMAQRLDRLVDFGENAVQIMNGLQVAAAKFLEDFSSEADKNSKAAKRAIWVGIFAIFLSIAQILYAEHWRVPQDSAAMEEAIRTIQKEIDQLQASITTNLNDARLADQVTERSLLDAIGANQVADNEVRQMLLRMLQEQDRRDQAILEFLGRLAERLDD